MDMVSLTVVGVAVLGGGLAWARRQRRQRLPVTAQTVRCPLHESHALVRVRTDSRAHREYVAVTGCSLLSDAAVALPERSGYLTDGPPLRMCLEAATTHPVYTSEVSCPQHCIEVLNEAKPPVPSRPVECTSGASDGIDLVRQTIRNPTIARILWYSSM